MSDHNKRLLTKDDVLALEEFIEDAEYIDETREKVRGILLYLLEQLRLSHNHIEESKPRYKQALEDIAEGAGPFNRNPLKHCENTIEYLVHIAKEALKESE